jgi:hypothetical protein
LNFPPEPKEIAVRYLRSVSLLFLAALLAAGCSSTPSAKDGANKDSTRKPLGDTEFKVASREFVAEFKKDSKAAHAKYKGKTVEVTGLLKSVGTNGGGDPVLLIEGEPMKSDFTSCITVERYPGKLAVPGQTITVKGRAHPDFPGPNLLDVEIVKVEGDKPPSLTADALAAEFAKGHEAAAKKYENKWVALSGEIEKVNLNDVKAATVVFKTTEKKPRVVALFTAFDEKRNTAFKPGQKIEVIGELSPLTVSEDEVGLFTPELIAAPK